MKKYILPGLLFLFYVNCLYSQWSPHDYTILGTPYNVVIDFGTKSDEYMDSYYLDEEWHLGNFTLISNQTISNYLIKYDLKNNNLEIQFSGEIKILDLYKMKEFSWEDGAGVIHRFVNLNIKATSSELYGIAQLLYDGKAKLLKTYAYRPKPESDVKYGAYQAIDHNYVQEDLYIMEGEKTLLVNGNKKRFMKFFNNYSSVMMSYIKSNNLKINKVPDLKMIVAYYNSLIKTVFIS